MSLQGRDLINISDFSLEELVFILDQAEAMEQELRSDSRLLAGCVLATAFYEPSTRTRLSFEAAMLRLDGGVIGFADPRTSSVAKGETIADTVRILESYADIIVMRHWLEGAAQVAADYAHIPIINAGDGGHQHPTQTLTDLFTIRRGRGQVAGAHIGLCGDLKFGRTVHSLLTALRHFDVRITCIAPESLQLPEHYLHPGQTVQRTTDLAEVISDLDVLYMTRIQKERFASLADYEAVRGTYVIDPALLSRAKPEMLILHPLPRVDEISYQVDADRRAAYFGQAAYGVPVRMALLAALLGRIDSSHLPDPSRRHPPYRHDFRCPNSRCVNFAEPYTEPRMEPVSQEPLALKCGYCEQQWKPGNPQGS